MAFIQVAPADDARWTELRSDPSFRHAQTCLLARDKREVVALPDIALEDLAEEIQVREDAITMTTAGDGSVDELELVQVSCLAERRKALALREELMHAGHAGFSRETAIFISRDPDSLE